MDDGPRLIVLRCSACGDTFSVHADEEENRCPSCGGDEIEPAVEPFL